MLRLEVLIRVAKLYVMANGAWHLVQRWTLTHSFAFSSGGIWVAGYGELSEVIDSIEATGAIASES